MSIEQLLNHTELHSLLYSGNTKGATQLLRQQCNVLVSHSLKEIRLYLSSINQGMYHYILNKENISLHNCCYENEQLISQCTSITYLSVGEYILNAYATCTDYLIEKHQNPHIKNAIAYIHCHLAEPLTLSVVCDAVALNQCYLCSLFSKEVGMSFSKYVVLQRISLSKQLMRTTSLPLTIVASKCGFQNVSYFCTSFKKIEGCTPSQYLANQKEKKALSY